ncbi:copper ABC transporter permease [Brochothrix thermosphacta]|uniref:YfhO family protein n=1 Tax=Brochothrix thermosphacta TaxID=2756 RepID=UPI00083F76C7|nr:YfhO family protein [Brochothrix thermosphacta]ODJ52136.1 copper ABC transporter permease [Brochothrix thermosphacta]
MKKIWNVVQSNFIYYIWAFMIPLVIMALVYYSLGIYWGSERSILASDSFSQYSNFHASLNNVLHGKASLFYNWNLGLGFNYYALMSYYLGGIFPFFVVFFSNANMPDVLYLMTIVKVGVIGLSFWIYAKETFKINHYFHLGLSVAYALMSFVGAYSMSIMWLDALIYLPMVVLGINRLLQKSKPTLLFVAYALLFISNYYMGFMVGIFTVMYVICMVILEPEGRLRKLVLYFSTSILAGLTSMIMILPMILDLRNNGEKLSTITSFLTEETHLWDMVVKSMIGVYDTTKYNSIPFTYVGLLPLIMAIFFFVTPKIALKTKVVLGSLLMIISISFNISALNLFWQGMHSPYMFLFRYSYLFSFTVVMLAGYGLAKYERKDSGKLVVISVILAAVFLGVKYLLPETLYTYVTMDSLYLTLAFLLIYVVIFSLAGFNKDIKKYLALLLVIVMVSEAAVNMRTMINGVLSDWNYPARTAYSEPYSTYREVVEKTVGKDTKEFYRTETMNPVSANDAINYGFNGISQFSSVRNRNALSFMNDLGFKSRGTNLNIRYGNNTLLMDALFGVRYNISKVPINKFGFSQYSNDKGYYVFRNTDALPLGMVTADKINNFKVKPKDNLGTQAALFSQLAKSTNTYFTRNQPAVVSTENITLSKDTNSGNVTYTAIKDKIDKKITWKVHVPANKQAYMSLWPTDYGQLSSSSVLMTVNGINKATQLSINGQYHDLGYYPKAQDIEFTTNFYGTDVITLSDPVVVFMDVNQYQDDVARIAQNGVDFKVEGRKATADVTVKEAKQTIFTTIPYDKGWKLYVDGKLTPINSVNDAFLSLPVEKGKHKIELVFFPEGLVSGIILFFVGIGAFCLLLIYNRRMNKYK